MTTFNNGFSPKKQILPLSGRKFDAAKLAISMRHETNDDGSQMFKKDEYLTAQQITSFWSRHAANVRAGAVDARKRTAPPTEAGAADEETTSLVIPLDEYIKDPNIPTEEMELRNINFDDLCQ